MEDEMVNRDEVKEVLLSKNPEFKTIYSDDEMEEIVDGIWDVEKVRKFMKGVDKINYT
jgi:uncharacterized pyridoxamine 5'-phosphate oxidase family protein